jgi:ribosomal protein S27E
MLPLYAARIEDLGPGEFVKVDCAACHHVALLTPEALPRVGLSPAAKVLDLKGRLRCRGCGRKGWPWSRLSGGGRCVSGARDELPARPQELDRRNSVSTIRKVNRRNFA